MLVLGHAECWARREEQQEPALAGHLVERRLVCWPGEAMSPVRPLAMEWHSLCRWWKQWRLRCLAVFVLHRLADELKG